MNNTQKAIASIAFDHERARYEQELEKSKRHAMAYRTLTKHALSTTKMSKALQAKIDKADAYFGVPQRRHRRGRERDVNLNLKYLDCELRVESGGGTDILTFVAANYRESCQVDMPLSETKRLYQFLGGFIAMHDAVTEKDTP